MESKKALPKEPRGGYGGYVGYPGMPGGGRMPFLPGSACVLDAQLDNSDLIEHSGWNRLIFYVHLNQKHSFHYPPVQNFLQIFLFIIIRMSLRTFYNDGLKKVCQSLCLCVVICYFLTLTPT